MQARHGGHNRLDEVLSDYSNLEPLHNKVDTPSGHHLCVCVAGLMPNENR